MRRFWSTNASLDEPAAGSSNRVNEVRHLPYALTNESGGILDVPAVEL